MSFIVHYHRFIRLQRDTNGAINKQAHRYVRSNDPLQVFNNSNQTDILIHSGLVVFYLKDVDVQRYDYKELLV